MTKIIEVELNGEKKKGILIEKIRRRKRKKEYKDRTYEWIQREVIVYIPKEFEAEKYVLVPL